MADQDSTDNTRPEHTEVEKAPTVASVATVASTSGDVEAAEPSHPDRPVGVNVDTAAVGLDEEELNDVPIPGGAGDDPLPAELDDSGLFEGDDERFGGGHVGAGPRPGESDGAPDRGADGV
jgi:hypothetical protein